MLQVSYFDILVFLRFLKICDQIPLHLELGKKNNNSSNKNTLVTLRILKEIISNS